MIHRELNYPRWAVDYLWFRGKWSLATHKAMIEDQERTDTFRRAIEEVVRPGDVVLDVGSGTGILSLFAARAGAGRVYGIEGQSQMLELARALARENGLDDRVRFLKGFSTELELPERADVLVTETLGHMGVDEGILTLVVDARQRLLRPGARIIPARFEIHLAPVEDRFCHTELPTFWRRSHYGLTFEAVAEDLFRDRVYVKWIDPDSLLCQRATMASFDLNGDVSCTAESRTTFFARRRGTLHGFASWFSAQLSPSVRIRFEQCTSWYYAFLPLRQPIPLEEGAPIAVSWAWQESPQGYCLTLAGTAGSGGDFRICTPRAP